MDAELAQTNIPPVPFNLADTEAVGSRRAQFLSELDGRARDILRARDEAINCACAEAMFRYRQLAHGLRVKYGFA